MFSATGTYEGGYGEARSTGTAPAVTANTQRYIGGYQEAANLYKLGARYYATTTGRFTQMDPSGQDANPDSYAGANPITFTDRTGLAIDWATIGQYTLEVAAGLAISAALAGTVIAACAATVVVGCIAVAAVAGGMGL